MDINSFQEIEPQKIIDHLCAAYRELDKHLMSPKHGLPKSFSTYWYKHNSKNLWLFSKYFRNITALEKFETCIERLDEFLIAIEYFNGHINFERKGKSTLSRAYKDRFFCSILVDSFRSFLDIFAKYIAWYFDISGKEEIGFAYKSFIVPLKKFSMPLSDRCNAIYKSASYKIFKNYRDTEKHIGFDKTKLKIKEIKDDITIQLSRKEIFDISKMEKAACTNLKNIIDLIDFSVSEFQKWHLGYDSPNDKIGEEMSDGSIKISS